MNPGDIILVRGNHHSLIDDAIMLGEYLQDHKGTYSHVALCVGNGQLFEAQGFRQTGLAPVSKYNGTDVGYLELTPEQRERIVEYTSRFAGENYDWLGISCIIYEILTGIVLPYKEKHTHFCSSLIQAILLGSIQLQLTTKRLPTPDDVAFAKGVHIESGGV